MAIRDALAPIIQLLLFILYGIYIFLGLVLMIAGIYYVSQIEGANTFAAVVCIMCGFFMLIVGALAIFGNLKKNALIFAVVLLIDVALFVLLLSAMMVGMAIVNEVDDPVAKAVNEAYCDNPAESLNDYCKSRAGVYSVDNEGILLRQSVWDGVVQLFDNGAPASCKVYDASLRIQSKAKAADAATCESWTDDLQVLPVTAVAEKCEAGGCKSDSRYKLDTEVATTCTYTPSDDATAAVCELGDPATMKGSCDFTAEVVDVAAEPKCGKGDFAGCFFHVAETYVAPVPDVCVATAPRASVGPTNSVLIQEGDAYVTELSVDGACVPVTAAEGTPAKAEHCLTTKAWAADLSADEMAVQASWEIDLKKECEAETICAMSQSMDSNTAIAASCDAIAGWGAATCTPISSDPSYQNACSGSTDKAACEAVATWVTSDDVAATATGASIAVGDKFSPPACVHTAAKAAPTCVAPVEAAAVKVQRTTCMAVEGCAYTAAMLAKAGAVGSETAGACVAVSGEGVCTYKPTTAEVAPADCQPKDIERVTQVDATCVRATGTGSCPAAAAGATTDVLCVPAGAVTDPVTTCTFTAVQPVQVGTCELNPAQTTGGPFAADGTTPLYDDASCIYKSGVEDAVTCKLTDYAGLTAGVTGDGVLEECYEETHIDSDDDDEDGGCTFRRGNDEYMPSLCKDGSGNQVMGTCGAILDLATTAMATSTCELAGTGNTVAGAGCTANAANSADCLASALVTSPVTSCVFTPATTTDAAVTAYDAQAAACAGTAATADKTAEAVCGDSTTCKWNRADCTGKDGMEACNNIKSGGDGVGLTVAAGATAFSGAAEKMLVDPTCATPADCKTIGSGAGNCTEVFLAFGPATKHECKKCWADWQTYSIDKIKGNLWPATIVIWSLFLFVVILVCINNYMIDNCEDDDGNFGPDGLWKIIGIVFNGIVALFGLLTMIMGIVAHSDLSGGCPEGKDCTNWAVVGVIVLGIFFILTAILSLVGMLIGKFPGMMMVRVADLILVLLGLLLLIMGIGFAIIAGAMDDINSANEDNFAQVRAQYESEDPDLCKGLSDSDCRSKIKEKTEGGMTTVVIILGLVCFEFIFVIFLTLQAFYIYKGGDGDDDDDDDDD